MTGKELIKQLQNLPDDVLENEITIDVRTKNHTFYSSLNGRVYFIEGNYNPVIETDNLSLQELSLAVYRGIIHLK